MAKVIDTPARVRARNKYSNKITRVQVNLNPDNPDDAEILSMLNDKENPATQLKRMLREAVTIRKAIGR